MWVICSSCEQRTQETWSAMRRATRPRCQRCGGPLNTFKEAGIGEPATQKAETPKAGPPVRKYLKLKGGLEL